MIRRARDDGKMHWIDTELGDLFFQGGEWWVVQTLGETSADGLERLGSARQATVADAVALLSDIEERLTRIEDVVCKPNVSAPRYRTEEP